MKRWGFGLILFLLFFQGCDSSKDSLLVESKKSITTPGEEESSFSRFYFSIDGEVWNLGEGKYLVDFLSDSCRHCESSVALMNDFLARYDSEQDIRIMALCLGEADTLQAFRSRTAPNFPTILISSTEFFAHIGSSPPRFHAVQDGKSLQYWDDNFPAEKELLAVFNP